MNEIDCDELDIEATDISRPRKKRAFEFDLSQTNTPSSTVPCLDLEQNRPSVDSTHHNRILTSSYASRRTILDCIEEGDDEDFSSKKTPSQPGKEIRIGSQQNLNFFEFASTLNCGVSDERPDFNHYDSTARDWYSKGQGPVKIMQARGHGVNVPENLRTDTVGNGCLRPLIPGPASSRFDFEGDPEAETIDADKHLELPLRMRHLCVSPTDPDFTAFSWKKMLQDLDLQPYTGYWLI